MKLVQARLAIKKLFVLSLLCVLIVRHTDRVFRDPRVQSQDVTVLFCIVYMELRQTVLLVHVQPMLPGTAGCQHAAACNPLSHQAAAGKARQQRVCV